MMDFNSIITTTIQAAVIGGVLGIIIGVINYYQDKKSEKLNKAAGAIRKDSFTVRVPIYYLLAAIIGSAVCIILCVFIVIDVANANYVNEGMGDIVMMVICILFFAAMTITTLWFLLYCVFWKIQVVGSEVAFTAFRKTPRSFSLTEVKRAEIARGAYDKITIVTKKGRIVSLISHCRGYKDLMTCLKHENIDVLNASLFI